MVIRLQTGQVEVSPQVLVRQSNGPFVTNTFTRRTKKANIWKLNILGLAKNDQGFCCGRQLWHNTTHAQFILCMKHIQYCLFFFLCMSLVTVSLLCLTQKSFMPWWLAMLAQNWPVSVILRNMSNYRTCPYYLTFYKGGFNTEEFPLSKLYWAVF